jgi:hypothetical protein
MAANDYHFVTHWRVQSTVQEITEILTNGPDLMRWWPSVYLEVRQLEKGDENGVGSVVDLYTKGWLPYRLRWQFRVTEAHHPNGFSLEAWGDFVGTGVWTFTQDGDWVNITYEWTVRADKPLLRDYSWAMKPIFAMNHRWAMEMGARSLELELQRRRAKTPTEAALVPAPPPPTSDAQFILGGLGVAALLLWLFSPRKK